MPFRLGSICPEIYLGFCYVYLTCANIIKPYRILPTPMLAFFFLFNFNMLGLNRKAPAFLLQVTGWFISQMPLYLFYRKEKEMQKNALELLLDTHFLFHPQHVIPHQHPYLKSYPSLAQPRGRQEELNWLILYRMRMKENGASVYLCAWAECMHNDWGFSGWGGLEVDWLS